MAIGLVDHFNIVISPSQVDETLRFYREVLGLKEGFRPDFGRPGWWLYAGGHPVLHISLKKDIPPTKGSTGSFDHIALNATGWAEMKGGAMGYGLWAMGKALLAAGVPLVTSSERYERACRMRS